MRVPFQLFCSPSTAGSTFSSLDYLALLPARSLNAANTQLLINATTGNVCVRDKEFQILDAGDTSIKLGMVWNSRLKRWEFAAAPKINLSSGIFFRAKSLAKYISGSSDAISFTEADGTQLEYIIDNNGKYICTTAGSGGLSYLTKDDVNNTFTRLFPATGVKEIFANDGTLTQRIYPDNIIYRFEYDVAGKIKNIHLPSGRKLSYSADANNSNLMHLILLNTSNQPIPLADYSFNGGANLTTKIFNDDGTSYQTTYTQLNNTLNIISEDNTQSAVTCDNAGNISSVAEGPSNNPVRNWSFRKDASSLSVSDANKNTYRVTLDNKGYLASFTKPGDIGSTVYGCNDKGQPESITTPDMTVRSRKYATTSGQLTNDTVLKNSDTIIYNDNDPNSSIFGTKWAIITSDDGVKKGKFLIYNDQRQLIYEVSAEGRVTRHFYETLSINDKIISVLSASKRVISHKFDVTKINLDDIATFPAQSDLDAFWGDVDNTQLQVTTYGLDSCARTETKTTFNKVDASGNGIQDPATAVITNSMDEKGRTAKLDVAVTDTSVISTKLKYDGLDRVSETVEGAQSQTAMRKTKTTWSGNTTTINRADFYKEIQKQDQKQDQGGLVISTEKSDLKNNFVRSSSLERNPNGSISGIIGEDGKKIREIRDPQGRIQFRILPGGNLEEHLYDLCGRPTCTRKYSILMPNDVKSEDIPGLIAGDINALKSYDLYDDYGQLAFEVIVKRSCDKDESVPSLKAFVTQHFYQFGNKCKTINYAKAITSENLSNLTYHSFHPQVVPLDENDDTPDKLLDDNDPGNRIKQYFYDRDGLSVGEQDCSKPGMGFLTKWERDGAGNVYHEIIYQTATLLSSNIDAAIPVNSKTIENWKWYDNSGRMIAVLDADNILTSYTYFANGKIKNETQYKSPKAIDTSKRTIVLPEPTDQDHIITYGYDELGRKNHIENSASGLIIDIKYDINDNEVEYTLTDSKANPITVRKHAKEYDAFSEILKDASARVLQTGSQPLINIYHPTNGLKLATIDEKGLKTLLYYDANRRPVLEISPFGTVKQYQYDNVCGKRSYLCCYSNRIAADKLSNLVSDMGRDGFFDARDFNDIIVTDKDNDQINKCTHDAEGLLLQEIDPTDAVRDLFYNSFRQVEREIKDVDIDESNQKIRLTTDQSYDNRGNRITTSKDPEGINAISSAEYDDPLNRPTSITGVLGRTVTSEYTGLREEIKKDQTDSINNLLTKTITKDAFLRPDTETDWNNQNPVKHVYNEVTREHRVLSREGLSQRDIVETSNGYGEIDRKVQGENMTQFQHGVDGQVEVATFADKSTDLTTFDVQGLVETYTNRAGKKAKNDRNTDNQIKSTTEDPDGESRETTYTPNVFGINTLVTSPDDRIVGNDILQAGLIQSKIQDPDHLDILSCELRNFSGGLKQIEQGTTDTVMYREKIKRDLLNREIFRGIDMLDNTTVRTIRQQEWDKAGNLLCVTDGAGAITRQIFDARGNLRFAIDAEGFVVEKQYDVNNKEIMRCKYVKPITQVALAGLNVNTTPQNFQDAKYVMTDKNDAIRYRVYDKDGFPCYEINLLEETKDGRMASVREWQYGTSVAYSRRLDYANSLNLDQCEVDFNKPNALEALRQYLSSSSISDPDHDRIKDVCRNALGKGIYTRDGEGYILEKRYGKNGKVVARTRYADKYQDTDFPQDPDKIQCKLNLNNPLNRSSYMIYDLFGNLRFTIDGVGLIKQFTYDKDNHARITHSYETRVSQLDGAIQTDLQKKLANLENDPNPVLDAMIAITANLTPKASIELTYDAAGRQDATIDGFGKSEELQLNALGLIRFRKDKRGKKWEKRYDPAKQLVSDLSPEIKIADLNLKDDIETSVETSYGYDDAFNRNFTTFAANIDKQQRQVTQKFDRRRFFTGTKITGVTIDDGTETLPTKNGPRPEIDNQTIETTRVLDHAGRELVAINEKGNPSFTVYDAIGRTRFKIDKGGYITKFNYQYTFKNHSRLEQYTQNIDSSVLQAHQGTGFTIDEIETLITQTPKDRKVDFVYDRRGDAVSATRSTIITGQIMPDGTARREDMAPETHWQRNAFGEVIAEDIVCDKSGTTATTYHFFDNNGNEILTVSPNGYVTVMEYGIRHIDPKKQGYVLDAKTEHAKAIDLALLGDRKDLQVNSEQIVKNILANVTPDPYDREYQYKYDCRLLQTEVTISSEGETFYTPSFDPSGKLLKGPGQHSLNFKTRYDADGNVTAHVMPNGDVRYVQRNDRGDVIAETSPPKALDPANKDNKGQPKKLYAVTQHKVNAHKQTVGSTTFINPCELSAITCEDGEVSIPDVQSDSTQDKCELLYMDSRGKPIVVQSSQGPLKFMTYDKSGQMVRSYQWVSGYQQIDGIPTLVPGLHLHGQRLERHSKEHVNMMEKIDDSNPDKVLRTYKDHDAFGQCIAEGPNPTDRPLKREFDNDGNQIWTNEEGCIPTVMLPNAKGEQVLAIRSQNNDLSQYLGNQEAAMTDLVDKKYRTRIDQYQQTAYQRDAEGRLVRQYLPFVSRKTKDSPFNEQMSFSVVKNPAGKPAGTYIAWRAPDIKFLVADFQIRLKDTDDWQHLPEIKPDERPVDPDQDIRYVDVSNLPADTYKYCLNFYFAEPTGQEENGYPVVYDQDKNPSFRAEGSAVIDTGNYTNSVGPVWYLNPDNKLVIGGKCDDISGIELVRKDGSVYKRLAGTRGDNGSLIVDLSQEDSDDYDVKMLTGLTEGTTVQVGQTSDYQLSSYQPTFQFTGPSSMLQVISGVPEGLTLGGVVAPSSTYGFPTYTNGHPYFQLGHNDKHPSYISASQSLSTAIIYGVDADNQPFYLGTFNNTGAFVKGANYHCGFQAHNDRVTGTPFLLLKLTDAEGIKGIKIGEGSDARVYQCEKWANGTFKLPIPPGFNPQTFTAKLIDLDSASVSDAKGKISLRTTKKPIPLSAKEINVSNFVIDRYQEGGFCEGHEWVNYQNCYYHYRWNSNLPPDARLHIAHNNVNQDIYDISSQPVSAGGQYKYFQAAALPPTTNLDAGMITLKVTYQGDTFDLVTQSPGDPQPVQTPAETIERFGNAASIVLNHRSTNALRAINLLYLSPLPSGVANAYIEIMTNTSVGKDIWVPADITKTQNGIIVRPGNLQPDIYQFRVCLFDSAGKVIDLSDSGLLRDSFRDASSPGTSTIPANLKPVWSYGSLKFSKGDPGLMNFVSRNGLETREIVRPVAVAEQDRYHNTTATISPENYAAGLKDGNMDAHKEETTFNLNNQPVRKTSPVVDDDALFNKGKQTRLVNETIYNTDSKPVGNIAPVDYDPANPDAVSNLALVNADNKTLVRQDADMVQSTATADALGRTTSTYSKATGNISMSFKRQDALTIETRTYPETRANGEHVTEEFETNEESKLIRQKDRLGRNSYGDFDMEGHEILHINIDGKTCRAQAFDPRTGMQLYYKDENGYEKKWNDPATGIPVSNEDAYFGNCRSYTDMAGQVIEYILNFNKQITEEKGDISKVTRFRGVRLDVNNQEPGNTAPPAKHILHLKDEGGKTAELLDLGANLVTRISHDLDDYEDTYFFINNDGRIYQATRTIYDNMHRIKELADTRYVIRMGYDRNNNRRFARAYFASDVPKEEAFRRESWFKYTQANRPLVRDGVLSDGAIDIAPGQGTAFTTEDGQVKSQEYITRAPESQRRRDDLSYAAGGTLNNSTTRNAADDVVIANKNFHRDEGLRLDNTTVTGCDIKLLPTKPTAADIASYQIPTYVLSFSPVDLHYYTKGNDQTMKLEDVKHLEDILRLYRGIPFDQIPQGVRRRAIAAIQAYNTKEHGDAISDTTIYDNNNDSARVQVHSEKNGKLSLTRTVTSATPSGLPLGETTVSRQVIEEGPAKGKSIDVTMKYNTTLAFGDNPSIDSINVVGKPQVDAPKDYEVTSKDLRNAQVFSTRDANNAVTSIQGALAANDPKTFNETFRSFITNSQGSMVFKQSAAGRNYYFYAQKQPGKPPVLMAYYGDLPDTIKAKLSAHQLRELFSTSHEPTVVNIDTNNEPISAQYPPPMPIDYVVTEKTDYRKLAEELNYTGYAAIIAHANGVDNIDDPIPAGTHVKIPPLYFTVADTAWNGPTCNMDRMIGSLYPVTPLPVIQPKPAKINWVAEFLEVAATIAIMAFAPEVFAGMIGMAIGSATTLALAGVGETMAAYGLAGVTASLAGQGIAIAGGMQQNLNLKSAAISGVEAAISGGMMKGLGYQKLLADLSKVTPGTVITNVVRAEGVALAQQAALVATHLQDKIDLRALVQGVVNGVVNSATDEAFGPTKTPDGLPLPGAERAHVSLGNRVASAGVTAVANTLESAAIYHQQLSLEGISTHVAGSMVGSAVGESISDSILEKQKDAAHAETSTSRTSGRSVAALGQQRVTGPGLFDKDGPVVKGEVRHGDVDAVKEAKATRAERWNTVPEAGSWQERYQSGIGTGTGSWQDSYIQNAGSIFEGDHNRWAKLSADFNRVYHQPNRSLQIEQPYLYDNGVLRKAEKFVADMGDNALSHIKEFGSAVAHPLDTLSGLGTLIKTGATIEFLRVMSPEFRESLDGAIVAGVKSSLAETGHQIAVGDYHSVAQGSENVLEWFLPFGKLAALGKLGLFVGRVGEGVDKMNLGGESVKLYRAIKPSELEQIIKDGSFKIPIPEISAEGKYFSTSLDEVVKYAQMAEKSFGDPPYAFVKTSFPIQNLTEIMKANVDRGIPALVIPENEFYLLSRPEIINLNIPMLSRKPK